MTSNSGGLKFRRFTITGINIDLLAPRFGPRDTGPKEDADGLWSVAEETQAIVDHALAIEAERDELRARLEKMQEAAKWVLHVANGVSKHGPEYKPGEAEYTGSLNALEQALSPDSPAAGKEQQDE